MMHNDKLRRPPLANGAASLRKPPFPPATHYTRNN